MVTSPDTGFDVAVEFDCENIADPEELLESISLLKRHMIGGPIRKALMTLMDGTSESLQPCSVSFRKGEVMYVTPSDSKIFVSFLLDFVDNTDKAMARVFLQVNTTTNNNNNNNNNNLKVIGSDEKAIPTLFYPEIKPSITLNQIINSIIAGICGSSAHCSLWPLHILLARASKGDCQHGHHPQPRCRRIHHICLGDAALRVGECFVVMMTVMVVQHSLAQP
jgi:hypothetical protein